MFCIFQKLRLLRRFELRQAVQQHLQNFQLVVQKPRRVVAVSAIAGKKPVNHAVQTLFKVVQEEGKVCKVFVTDSFAYVVVQLHLRRFRVKLKDVPDFAHGQIVGIIERQEYTGCTCNFKTYSKSYKLKKRIPNNPEDIFIVPDTQEAIASQAQWDRVQELRKNKRRPVKAERQGLFAGLVYCAGCGSKLHFATCKGFEGKQDHYRCSKYKSGRGECSAHYIREDVLRELVQERIQAVNAYIRSDVEGFQEEWLHYRRADQERDIREDQKRMEQAKKRLANLDVVMSRLYEDYALGEISKEKYKKMTADYEAEQERLKLEIETTEEWVEQRQAMGDDLDAFIALTKKYVDVTELTQTIVNEYIRKIVIHAPDKSGGKRRQKVEIFFNLLTRWRSPCWQNP